MIIVISLLCYRRKITLIGYNAHDNKFRNARNSTKLPKMQGRLL